jgi:hypothetical protein
MNSFINKLVLFLIVIPFHIAAVEDFSSTSILLGETMDERFQSTQVAMRALPQKGAWVEVDFDTHTYDHDSNYRLTARFSHPDLQLKADTREIFWKNTLCAKVYPRRWGMERVKMSGQCKFRNVKVKKADPNDWYGRQRLVWQTWIDITL